MLTTEQPETPIIINPTTVKPITAEEIEEIWVRR